MTIRLRTQITALTTIAGTLPGRIPNPWPTRLATHIAYIDAHIDNALDNLRTATPDGWGTSASGADIGNGSRGTGHTTSVEAALTGRLDTRTANVEGEPVGPVAAIEQLEEILAASAALIAQAIDDPPTANTRCLTANERLKQACNIVDRWYTHERDLKTKLTCNCGGLDGWMEWGDPLCDNIASPGKAGLCSWRKDDGTVGCHERREAWRKRQERARQRIDPRTKREIHVGEQR